MLAGGLCAPASDLHRNDACDILIVDNLITKHTCSWITQLRHDATPVESSLTLRPRNTSRICMGWTRRLPNQLACASNTVIPPYPTQLVDCMYLTGSLSQAGCKLVDSEAAAGLLPLCFECWETAPEAVCKQVWLKLWWQTCVRGTDLKIFSHVSSSHCSCRTTWFATLIHLGTTS